jgi:hypothetical protein
MHKATARFWRRYDVLDADVKKLADKNFDLLKLHPSHPSLKFKKVGKFWSARVGLNHRALAVEATHGFTWVWIGTHHEYDQLIAKR